MSTELKLEELLQKIEIFLKNQNNDQLMKELFIKFINLNEEAKMKLNLKMENIFKKCTNLEENLKILENRIEFKNKKIENEFKNLKYFIRNLFEKEKKLSNRMLNLEESQKNLKNDL